MTTKLIASISAVGLILASTSGPLRAQPAAGGHDTHHPAETQEAPDSPPDRPEASERGRPDMGAQAMMGHGERHAQMMRFVLTLMDTDGDGALSLEETLVVTDRFFSAIDANDDGRATPEELEGFHGGEMRSPDRTQMPSSMDRQTQDGTAVDRAAASQAYMQAMQTMTQGMADMKMTGDPAKDFAIMMIPHHQSAIDLANVYLQYSDDPELTELTNGIVAEQQREIEFLRVWLQRKGQ